MSSDRLQAQNRKAARHYDAPIYNRTGPKVYSQTSKVYKPTRTYNEPAKVYSEPAKVYGEPERVYGEPAKVYSEPAKVYSEPAKVYSEPAKVYSEPAKIYGEPEKVYSEPSKIYSEPAKVYSEPAKIYSQPAKMYGEPSKVYDSEGQPVDRQPGGEPDEQNYEIDESVSVGSNGNVHGPQLVVTEISATSEFEDGRKVDYVEDRNFRKYRVEERTPDGFIVGEYGIVSHDDGSLRGVRYTADGTIDPQLIYDALKKFLSL
ncbi:Golgin subfamily A member 6-like protein 1 [Harpegnathos saltator]|uniref:Golgin subfamily A member 6-like protein 1 n=2 Tax=Harpegnathos saltator TaxID=610380 RepID=E2B5N0_HARSA|nr:Golgin subfamily A member 6-like protein 1 [Harpegnathos saltator]